MATENSRGWTKEDLEKLADTVQALTGNDVAAIQLIRLRVPSLIAAYEELRRENEELCEQLSKLGSSEQGG